MTEEYRWEFCSECGEEVERLWVKVDGEWRRTRFATLCACDAAE